MDSDKQIHVCSEEYDETCKIGTGVAPRSALGWRTSLSTSWVVLMADPAGAGMTGIKFGQKGPVSSYSRVIRGQDKVLHFRNQHFQVSVNPEDAVDRG